MRRIALVTGILGLGLIVAFLINEPIRVESLDGLIVGEVVSISGIVGEQRKFGNGQLLIIKEIPVFCECNKEYVGRHVIIEGIVERFPENLRIKVFTIKVLD